MLVRVIFFYYEVARFSGTADGRVFEPPGGVGWPTGRADSFRKMVDDWAKVYFKVHSFFIARLDLVCYLRLSHLWLKKSFANFVDWLWVGIICSKLSGFINIFPFFCFYRCDKLSCSKRLMDLSNTWFRLIMVKGLWDFKKQDNVNEFQVRSKTTNCLGIISHCSSMWFSHRNGTLSHWWQNHAWRY